jgi:hypothetical protein
MVLEAFRMILAQALELAKHKEKRAHERFDGLVRPMYERIQEIHRDYIAMFDRALLAVQQDVPLAEVVSALELDRRATRAMRHEFFRVVEAIEKNDALTREVLDFVNAIAKYVESLAMYSQGTPATVVRTYLVLLVEREEGENNSTKLIEAREHSAHMLKRALVHLDQRVSAISSSYAVLLGTRYI